MAGAREKWLIFLLFHSFHMHSCMLKIQKIIRELQRLIEISRGVLILETEVIGVGVLHTEAGSAH